MFRWAIKVVHNFLTVGIFISDLNSEHCKTIYDLFIQNKNILLYQLDEADQVAIFEMFLCMCSRQQFGVDCNIINSWNVKFSGYFCNTRAIIYHYFFNLHDCTINFNLLMKYSHFYVIEYYLNRPVDIHRYSIIKSAFDRYTLQPACLIFNRQNVFKQTMGHI